METETETEAEYAVIREIKYNDLWNAKLKDGQNIMMWDKTSHGQVANVHHYSMIVCDFHKEKMKVSIKMQQVPDALEFLRKKLVASMRVGKNLIINCNNLVPDFNEEYNGDDTLFPSDLVFNPQEWTKSENYMKIVHEDENYDHMMTKGNYFL